MDLVLREMCIEVLEGDVNSDRFASLLIESGINPEGFEWDYATRLLERSDQMRMKLEKFGQTLN
jgi:hypothetical protein